jgi:formate dehydrogenase major subunit
MNIELSRRQFMHGVGASVAGTTLGALGFGEIETAYASSIRAWKLAGTTETRNTCTYCAVGCGIIMYSKGNLAKGERAEITHIEGDPDHPTNRGTLCPKGRRFLNLFTRKREPFTRKSASLGRTSSNVSLGTTPLTVLPG